VNNAPGLATVPLTKKVYAFYTRHGLLRTFLRAAERVTGRRLLAPPRPRRSDGMATVVLDSVLNAGPNDSVIRLPPGQAAIQEFGLQLDEILELDLYLDVHGEFDQGMVLLAGEKGNVIHQEFIQPGRVRNGSYALSFDKTIDVRRAGPLRLMLCNCGKRGEVRLRLAGSHPDLTEARHHVVHDRDPSEFVARMNGNGGSLLTGSLALRLAGRSSSALATYHRCAVPKRWQQIDLKLGELYTAGLRASWFSQASLASPKEATVKRIRTAANSANGSIPVLFLGSRIQPTTALELVREAQSQRIPIVGVVHRGDGRDTQDDGLTLAITQLAHWSDLLLVERNEHAWTLKGYTRSAWLCDMTRSRSLDQDLQRWLSDYRARIRPSISVVTILYKRASAIPEVLRSYFRQSYEGDIEIIFVDDASPDNSAEIVEQEFDKARKSGLYARVPKHKVIRNASNQGNCISRNIGIAQAQGDVVVVIDSDCMLNRDFLRLHAEAHSFNDCDVVIGPINIESDGRNPTKWLEQLESRPDIAAQQALPQYGLNRAAFMNCITRNFSIGRHLIKETLFDPVFSYSADPSSGFGWEDVEMGYRLYKRGGRIKYISDAFSVHISHEPKEPDRLKPARSIRNFRRLVEKHSDIRIEARDWIRETFATIEEWFNNVHVPPNDDVEAVRRLLYDDAEPKARMAGGGAKTRKTLRILTYRWHVAHQYELYKLGHHFSLVNDLDTPLTNGWDFGVRPLPDNTHFISHKSIRESDFDLAILHFDENVLSPENTNGVLGPEWGAAFRWFMEHVRLPKVAICHGTPQFYGQYNPGYDKPDLMEVIERARRKLVEYLGDTLVICNSHQAQGEWGFRRSRVIWHGFDPTELPPATYERGILSPMGPLVLSRPHYRGYVLYKKVFADFPAEFLPSSLFVPDPSPLYHRNQFATWKYRNYVDEIRRYSVYFNPTLRSPMPRARGEPMMCGVVTVSAKNHDVDMFIKNGINGFYADEPAELKEQLLFLLRNPVAAREIGAAGRRTALETFNIDRYLGDWRNVIQSLV
jgi:glycosyltransferase involved in cell wall biosynthesis